MEETVDVIYALTMLKPSDIQFISVLEKATMYQIKMAIGYMEHKGNNENKRISSCRAELRRRAERRK